MAVRLSAVAIFLVLAGCHAAVPGGAPETSGGESGVRRVPFQIRGSEPRQKQTGDSADVLRGVVEFGADRQVRVPVTERVLTTGPKVPLDSIKSGLGYGEFDAGWKEQAKSGAQRIARISATAADTLRDTLVFTFRGPRSSDLASDRLFFEIWGRPTISVSATPVNAFHDYLGPAGAFAAMAKP